MLFLGKVNRLTAYRLPIFLRLELDEITGISKVGLDKDN
jgi:hypothetical protein